MKRVGTDDSVVFLCSVSMNEKVNARAIFAFLTSNEQRVFVTPFVAVVCILSFLFQLKFFWDIVISKEQMPRTHNHPAAFGRFESAQKFNKVDLYAFASILFNSRDIVESRVHSWAGIFVHVLTGLCFRHHD